MKQLKTTVKSLISKISKSLKKTFWKYSDYCELGNIYFKSKDVGVGQVFLEPVRRFVSFKLIHEKHGQYNIEFTTPSVSSSQALGVINEIRKIVTTPLDSQNPSRIHGKFHPIVGISLPNGETYRGLYCPLKPSKPLQQHTTYTYSL